MTNWDKRVEEKVKDYAEGSRIRREAFLDGANWTREHFWSIDEEREKELDALKKDNLLALDIAEKFADERDALRQQCEAMAEALAGFNRTNPVLLAYKKFCEEK